MKKKLLTLLLSVVMIMISFPTNVFALADNPEVAEILSTVDGGFPTTFENSWINKNGAELYIRNGVFEAEGEYSDVYNHPTIKLSETQYQYQYSGSSVSYTFNLNEGKLDNIVVANATNEKSNGTYRAPTKDVNEWLHLKNALNGNPEFISSSYKIITSSSNETIEIVLKKDIVCPNTGDNIGPLIVPDGRRIKITLNNHKIDRGLSSSSSSDDGNVISINNGGYLSIVGDSNDANNIITGGNNTGNGGGIYNEGQVDLLKCQVIKNKAENGGGIYNLGVLSVNNCKISSNKATNGAGLFAESGTSTIQLSTILNNIASGNGGGIYTKSFCGLTTTFVEDCKASGNGGGAYVASGGRLEASGGSYAMGHIANCTATNNGGGIFVQWSDALDGSGNRIVGTATLSSAFEIDNCSASKGDGIYCEDVIGLENCSIKNCNCGVYITPYGRAFIGSKAKVVDNTTYNIYIEKGDSTTKGGLITIGTGLDVPVPQNDMKIGVTLSDSFTFTTNTDKDYSQYFEIENTGYQLFANANKTLFIAKPKTITFETNGGSVIQSAITPAGYPAKRPENPTKEGQKLVGWYSDSQLSQPYDFASIVNDDLTLYAKWEANENKPSDSKNSYVVPLTGVEGIPSNNHSLLKISSLSMLTIGIYMVIKKKNDN